MNFTLSYKELNIISSVLCRFQNNKILRSTAYPEEKDNRCPYVLKNTIQKYCKFDSVKTEGASVDCLTMHRKGFLVLLEIKNQPSTNIDIDQIKAKIYQTIKYLINNYFSLSQKKKIFLLSISEHKQPKKVGKTINIYFDKFSKYLLSKKLSIFNNRIYNILKLNLCSIMFSQKLFFVLM